jgi:hypothetical protein
MTVTVSYSRDTLRPEFRSNSFITEFQHSPDVVGTPDGHFVSAYGSFAGPNALEWYSAFASGPSGMPRFPAEGATVPGAPVLTELHDGSTLVVWMELDPGDPGVKGRRYGSDGEALGGELALVGGTAPFFQRVAGLHDGGFALTYRTGIDTARVAVFDDDGNGSILPGTIPAVLFTELAIAALPDGGFVVTHTGLGVSGTQQLGGRVYNSDGSVRRADLLIDSAGPGSRLEGGQVAGLPNGNWAVVWTEREGLAGSNAINMKIFDPQGDAVSGLIQAHAPGVLDNASEADVAVLPNGFIVVGWSRQDDHGHRAIHGRSFDQDGYPIDLGEFALSSSGSVHQLPALAAVGPSGQFVASWQDSTSDGSGGRITSVVSELVRHSTGDGADDTFTGDALIDFMQGGAGNDRFRAGGGANGIDGGVGDDTAAYDFALASFTVYQYGARLLAIRLTDDGALSQGDDMIGIERLQFADGTLAADDGNGVFDTFFYMGQNPDVFHAGVDAIQHYSQFGWHEGRDPNALFDTSAYLAANPDVVAAGVNPLEHYHAFGWREGRDPSARFDTTRYLIDNPDVAGAGVDPLEHYLTFGLLEARPARQAVGAIVSGFDAQYYLMHNPDVAAAGVDPLAHFRTSGWHEGRNPNGWFDTAAYLSHNPDVAAAGVDPFDHYMTFGWREGRDASDRFHTADYLAANPDVAAAGINPLEHFLQFGFYENRAGVDYSLFG